MNFPQLSNVNKTIVKTINDRIGNNLKMSQLKPWIRLMSATNGGLIVESLPGSDSFEARYGNSQKGGRIGINWKGESVYEEGSGRGYRPSPLIESLAVANGTSGLSRKISFNVKCFTLGQAELIMQYFNEPGYTILVEYGWNVPKSVQQKCPPDICSMVSYNSLGVLKQKRTNSEGCYDAFLGYITGGGMKYGDGESFDVAVELTTLGEIPAYLQQHKGVASTNKKGTDVDESGKVFQTWEINKAVKDEEIGKALFMQMYNELPSAKQIGQVKALINQNEFFEFGNKRIDRGPFADTGNFLNMDKEIREAMTDDMSDTNLRLEQSEENKGKSAKIPEGVPLTGSERFIRMGLAFKILNTVQYPFTAVKSACGDSPTMNFRILHDYCICRAHRHIFSTDPTKLFIPNKNMPEFGLKDALTATDKLDKFIDLQNITEVDVHPETTSTKQYFPNDKALSETGLPSTETYTWDSDYIPYVCDPFQYGLLSDLFINFDFFVSCLTKNGFVVKDVVLDMLNGISSAVNFYWDFQLNESAGGDGYINLAIIDESFCGKKANTDKITTWQSRGLDSPFTNVSLDFDIPGAMKNQIVAQRSSPNKSKNESFVQDGREIPLDTLFNKSNDPVLDVLNAMKSEIKESQNTNEEEPEEPTEKEKEAETRKANYELFVGKAGVYPKVQDRNGNTDAEKNWYDFFSDTNANTLEGLLFVGTWKDTQLLKNLQLIDEGKSGAIVKGGEGQTQNSVLLPIKFSFTVPGVSGMIIGNIFKIIDLPKKYRDRVFQVTQVEHNISDSGWETNIQAQIRNQT